MGNINLLSSGAPAVWAKLRELEIAAGTEIGDVEFDGNYGGLKATAWLWGDDAFDAMHIIAEHLGADLTIKDPRPSDAAPADSHASMRVAVPLAEASLTVRALIDTPVYEKAVEAREWPQVAA